MHTSERALRGHSKHISASSTTGRFVFQARLRLARCAISGGKSTVVDGGAKREPPVSHTWSHRPPLRAVRRRRASLVRAVRLVLDSLASAARKKTLLCPRALHGAGNRAPGPSAVRAAGARRASLSYRWMRCLVASRVVCPTLHSAAVRIELTLCAAGKTCRAAALIRWS